MSKRKLLGCGLVASAAVAVALTFGLVRSSAAGRHRDPAPPPPTPTITFVEVTAHGTDGQSDITFVARSFEVSGISDEKAKGSHEYSPFLLRKAIDSVTSHELEAAFASGGNFSSVDIIVFDQTGAPLFRYVLTDAWVAVFRQQASTESNSLETENVAFGFKTITYQTSTPVLDKASKIFLDREKEANPTNQG